MRKFKIISKGHGQSTQVEFDGKLIEGVQAVKINPVLPNEPVTAVIHVAFVDLEVEGDADLIQDQEVGNGEVVDTE